MIHRAFSKKIQEQQFNPGVLGVFTNPFYIARRELHKKIAILAPKLSGSLLDIGCGEKPYERLFRTVTTYTGMEFADTKSLKADVQYDGSQFPFPNNTFDSALMTEVLEHVFNPDEFLEEVRRVLKPGGMLLLTAPFLWDEHEQPRDYARYSSFGLRALLTRHGFRVHTLCKTAPDIRALFQLFNCYLYKKLPFKHYRVRLFFYIFFFSPFTILGILLSFILPRNDDLYLGNVVLAQKI